jgi:uncharacterized protein YkwD
MKIILFSLFTILTLSSFAQRTNQDNPFEKYTQNSINYLESCDFKKPVNEAVNLINEYRRQNGLNPVRLDPKMSTFANEFILKLLDENAFYHSDLNAGVYSVENLFTEFGFGSLIGLNEEWYNQIARQTFDTWKKSPGHNANMLNPDISFVGLSYDVKTKSKNGNYSYVLDGMMVGR